ncbi:SusD/RagB family nutrient-binding outer membrane lipoprotein [Pedobacter sp. PF22-3]|uniref:SusD/RagB family nutrient-binding outer membrane lipoprotein n=1 Tax=Pedobacter sp. PF22-3 TaxID=2994467 RepID=UPI0022463863|nr:SusD/RagB family nutrient-binding outer membrane lipoprotein [Pedobacter sp. PF22-3]MCX2493488.1 SusD/RagB family nutrient-binding outer membrane lipoprotein [Pedobacter sp. PF22-3]
MRKLFKIFILGTIILSGSSCKKFLDVNTNPNNPTSSTPNIVLPQAIVTSAAAMNTYDNFGAWTGGYKANAGGYGGWGTVWTYNFTTGDYAGVFTDTFAGINQLNFVINNTTPDGPLKYYNAMARIMKSFMYTKLVDQYGDVPYSDAGKGLNNLSPKYDKYTDVYATCFTELNNAIAIMNTAPVTNVTTAVTAAQDPLFGGSATANLAKWKQFANTIKLKMVIRAKNVAALSSFVTSAIASLPTATGDYVNDDVIVQPGYSSATASQFNPKWSTYAWDINGTAIGSGLSNLPTPWIVSFYNGTKLSDNVRGNAIYASFGTNISQTINGNTVTFQGPATNQLGYDTEPVKRSQNGSYWYSGVGRSSRPTQTTANAATDVGGVLKGASMGTVLMLASESYFLQAEASLASVNILPALNATGQTLFENGITASFNYLYKNAANVYFNSTPAATLKDNYKTANATSTLVNWPLALSDASKLEAIITQKYIAVNMINSEEGFNEYRRTGYPTISAGSTSATATFASLKSGAPALDKLPTRILYPAVEFQVNSENVPKGVSPYTTKIWYAK